MTEKKEDEKAAPQPAKRTWTEWIVDISVIFSLGLMASTANAPVSIAMRSLFVRLGIDPNSPAYALSRYATLIVINTTLQYIADRDPHFVIIAAFNLVGLAIALLNAKQGLSVILAVSLIWTGAHAVLFALRPGYSPAASKNKNKKKPE
jgi:hypothetical protein